MVAVTAERGIDMVFWALEQRRKRREDRERQMAQREAEIRAEAQGALLTALRTEARTAEDPEFEARVEHFAREKGIALKEPPPRE